MIVAHVGPPPRRIGGPAGYLHQLQTGAASDPAPRHDVRFPAASATPVQPKPAAPPLGLLTRLRRRIFGPKFYRPSALDLGRPGGVVDRMMREMLADVGADTATSLDAALRDADVIFTHEPFAAEKALARRRPGQQVWMLCHQVTPLALYVVWSWGVPEADWRTLVGYPDVRTWTDWEIDIWSRLDRLIIPCPEAGESFRTIDGRFNSLLDRASFILSGAAAPERRADSAPEVRGTDSAEHRRHAKADPPGRPRLGLYLGSAEPYRGFDALAAAVDRLPADINLSIAVAGPHPGKVPSHPVFRALGRVEDVAGLLASVDFLINVNRFNLFDLSTIEATQAGKPLLLHAFGGNRAFARLGAGCVMLDDVEPATIADGLTRMAALDAETLQALGRQSRACWEQQLTPRHMWERHLALYDEAARAR